MSRTDRTCPHEFPGQVTAVEKLKTVQSVSMAELDELLATLQHRAIRGGGAREHALPQAQRAVIPQPRPSAWVSVRQRLAA